MDRLCNISEAAHLLGISPWTVRAYLRAGKLARIHIGRRVLIEQEEIRRFVNDAKTVQRIQKC